jgi:aspartyl-tRNA(Asn)/glutamyl-tRNA(Gln) amidotransferase subunit B
VTDLEVVIGMEVHIQIATRTKMFCGCEAAFGGAPNSRCCPVCLGHPGTLPVLNGAALTQGLRLALALGCRIPERTNFDRKSYFYPDLPKGYQITQLDRPIGTGGVLTVETADGGVRQTKIRRVHCEEDSGKSEHVGAASSLIDFNRAGLPLLEIVGAPDLRSADEAVGWVRALREIAVHLGVSACSMDKGQLRCEPNVNLCLRDGGAQVETPVVEVKNLNSLGHLRAALAFEIERQREAVSIGGARTTRGWDEERGATVLLRTKEEERDYRYFPEPDLPSIDLDPARVADLQSDLPELPAPRRARFVSAYGLSPADTAVLCEDRPMADAFEETVSAGASPRAAAAWMLTDVRRDLNARGIGIGEYEVSPRRLASLIRMVDGGTVTRAVARDVLTEMAGTGRDAEEIVAERGLRALTDEDALAAAVTKAIAAHPGSARDFADGNDAAIGPLIGAALAITEGRADPDVIRRMLVGRMREKPGGS